MATDRPKFLQRSGATHSFGRGASRRLTYARLAARSDARRPQRPPPPLHPPPRASRPPHEQPGVDTIAAKSKAALVKIATVPITLHLPRLGILAISRGQDAQEEPRERPEHFSLHGRPSRSSSRASSRAASARSASRRFDGVTTRSARGATAHRVGVRGTRQAVRSERSRSASRATSPPRRHRGEASTRSVWAIAKFGSVRRKELRWSESVVTHTQDNTVTASLQSSWADRHWK